MNEGEAMIALKEEKVSLVDGEPTSGIKYNFDTENTESILTFYFWRKHSV